MHQLTYCAFFHEDSRTLLIRKPRHSFITSRQRSCGKVIFSLMSVYLVTGGPHMTITHNALAITVQPLPQTLDLAPQSQSHLPMDIRPGIPPPAGHQTRDPPALAQFSASGNKWSSLETCSNLFIWGPPGSNIWWWLLNHVWLAQEGDMDPIGIFLVLSKYVKTLNQLSHQVGRNEGIQISYFSCQ